MLERVLAVNVVGAFVCAREAVRRMSTARGGAGGAIVVVSSVAARIGSPNEVTEAVMWLLSPAASYVTGAVLDVSGGR
jgi:NAD(P)-dependent dehydrogenase (short-subunit alcohol dehydrogenase family)